MHESTNKNLNINDNYINHYPKLGVRCYFLRCTKLKVHLPF